MLKIVFKDLETSELAKEVVKETMEAVYEKFPDIEKASLVVTLSVHNSPRQAGPDVFTAKLQCRSGKFKGVVLEKEGTTLYKALSKLSDHLLERLNRFGEKQRVKNIKEARKFMNRSKFIDEFATNEKTY